MDGPRNFNGRGGEQRLGGLGGIKCVTHLVALRLPPRPRAAASAPSTAAGRRARLWRAATACSIVRCREMEERLSGAAPARPKPRQMRQKHQKHHGTAGGNGSSTPSFASAHVQGQERRRGHGGAVLKGVRRRRQGERCLCYTVVMEKSGHGLMISVRRHGQASRPASRQAGARQQGLVWPRRCGASRPSSRSLPSVPFLCALAASAHLKPTAFRTHTTCSPLQQAGPRNKLEQDPSLCVMPHYRRRVRCDASLSRCPLRPAPGTTLPNPVLAPLPSR